MACLGSASREAGRAIGLVPFRLWRGSEPDPRSLILIWDIRCGGDDAIPMAIALGSDRDGLLGVVSF
jgi:hypothetical protein